MLVAMEAKQVQFTDEEQAEIDKFVAEFGYSINAIYQCDLAWFVQTGSVAVTKYLVAMGSDIDARGYESGYTRLHCAANRGNVELVKYLISEGANVHAKSWGHGMTPLHFADNIEVAQCLVSKGAKVNAKDRHGRTPLFEKVYSTDIDIVKYLVSEGAKVNVLDNYDNTPLDVAKEYGKENTTIIEYLESVDAKPGKWRLYQRAINVGRRIRDALSEKLQWVKYVKRRYFKV